jgi:hypothetical protein
VAQVVELSSKCEALSSKPSAAKKKKIQVKFLKFQNLGFLTSCFPSGVSKIYQDFPGDEVIEKKDTDNLP